MTVAHGELTAVMGPSGSGKSTLMHILAGLDRPTSGTVSIEGTDITWLGDNDLTKLRREHIGFIFQFFNLLPMLTRRRTSVSRSSSPAARWTRRGSTRSSSRPASTTAAPTGLRSSRAASSSAWQSPALSTRPTVIFADEPTGNLDSTTSAEILDLVREMVTDYGQTTVMVTHDANAAAIADRVLFLADGCIVKELRGADADEIQGAMEEVSRR